MEQVTNKIFYHIQKINPNITPSLQKGLTYTAGKEKNPFISIYDNIDLSKFSNPLDECMLYIRDNNISHNFLQDKNPYGLFRIMKNHYLFGKMHYK